MTDSDNDTARPADEQLLLTWDNHVRLLLNPSVWSSMLLVLGVPSLLLGIFFALLAKRLVYLFFVPAAFFGGSLAIFVLVALVIDAFGGLKATFFLTTHGARFVAGRGAQAANTVAFLAGALSGKPGMAGAALLAESEHNVFIAWGDVTSIRVKASRHYILITRAWGDKPIGLYCTPENFRAVMDVLRAHVGHRMPSVGVNQTR